MKKRILTTLLTVFMLLSLVVPCYAFDYFNDNQFIAYGKIFKNGVNEVVDDFSQLDTYITDLHFSYDGKYIVEFAFNSHKYTIYADLVSAKMNNVENDHFVLSPTEKFIGNYEIVNISYTLNANKYDLLPVNVHSMIGKPVITIIITDGIDVYYWQSQILLDEVMKYAVNEKTVFLPNISTDTAVEKSANEYYFIKNNTPFEINIHSDEVMTIDEIDPSYFEIDFQKDNTLKTSLQINTSEKTNSTNATSHNPYYGDGVPDWIFKTINNSWTWRDVGANENGTVYPWRYYRYTYERYGSSNLYTSLVLLEVISELPENYSSTNINGSSYNIAETMVQIKIIKTPHTVVYYPNNDVFELMPGGENLIKLDKPVLQVVKNSTGVEHFVYGRLNFAKGTKSSSINAGVKALSSIAVKLLDLATHSIASTVYELSSIISSATYSIGENDGVSYEYYLTEKIGSMANTLDGYLHLEGHYYGMRCKLAAPVSAGDSVKKCFWNITTNIVFK